MKRLRQLLESLFLRGFCLFLNMLPPGLCIRIGRVAGKSAYHVCRKRVAMGKENLEKAFPGRLSDDERSAILKELFVLLGEVFIESVMFKQEDVVANVRVEGMRFLDEASRSGKGIIVLVPHFGIWEIASHVFGYYLNNASVIYKAIKNPYIDASIVKARLKSNLSLIPSKNALRPVLRNLKNGYTVGILFDQNAGRSGVVVDFFNRPALTYSAPAVFALKTGCVVLPAYMQRGNGLRNHTLVIGKPFEIIRTGDEQKDILLNTQQFNDYLEQLVRRNPESWFGWLHNRWKFPKRSKELI